MHFRPVFLARDSNSQVKGSSTSESAKADIVGEGFLFPRVVVGFDDGVHQLFIIEVTPDKDDRSFLTRIVDITSLSQISGFLITHLFISLSALHAYRFKWTSWSVPKMPQYPFVSVSPVSHSKLPAQI